MPTAAKHFDIVVGLDMHLVQPPGPVPPVPIPHPFVGIVFDPFDYLPLLGSTVTVSGLPRAQAGTAVMPIPPHIPIGGVFVKPPGNEGEVFMGSATVEVEGEPFGFMGVPALDCSDIGVPPPPRPPKNPDDAVPPKGGPMSLMLPSSVVLSIPIGRPVTVGGPPTISIFSAAFATASNAFAGLRKLQQRSERMRKVSRRMHDRAEQLMRAKGMSDTARHRVHTAICAVTGHPVDIATGKVFTDQVDFEFPAPLALAFERKWLSTSGHRGALGHGWHHGFDLELRVDEHTQLVAIRLADDRVLACPLLPVGERWFDRKDKLELVREASGFVLRERSGLRYGFVGSPSLDAAGEAAMPVAFVEDQAGHRIELVRDGAGRLLELRDAGRRRYPIAHDAEGRIISVHGPHPSGRGEVLLARYVYDRAGDLVEVHDGLGRVRRYAYRNHLLVRETDRAGLSFHFEYDDESKGIAARCLRTWGDEGIYDHRLDYAETHTAVTNSLGQRSVFHHSATAPGLIERVVDPLGHTHRVELDEWGDEKSEVDELGRTTRRSHDARGNVIEQVWPDGTTARFAYDAHDQLIRAIDQNGGWWQWTRDERGRLLARHDPDGGGLRVVWRGPFIDAIVDAQGRATRLEYDAANALVRAHLPDRATLAWAHDGAGHRIAQTSPTGAVQRLVRDELGRVLEVHEPDGLVRRYQLDGEGRPVRIEEGPRLIELAYVGMGKLARHRDAGIETIFHYDTELQLVGLTHAQGSRYQIERDARGDVIAEVDWAARRTELERDAAGQVVALTKPSGARSVHAWSRSGRLEQVLHADRTIERFVYRADGLLTHARNEACELRFERDAIGRIVREWQGDHWVASTYDRSGDRTSIASSFGTTVQIERDLLGRWSSLRAVEREQERWKATTTRDLLGLEIDRSLPGGARDRWSRDALGRPRQHQVWNGKQVVRDARYAWKVDARLGSLLDALSGTTTTYEHDALGRLAWAKRGDAPPELRVPDALGNPHRSAEQVDRQYGPDGRILLAELPAGPLRFEYDDDGQRVLMREADDRKWRYAWNAKGRLAGVERPDGKVAEFAYDALGRRISKRFGDVTTRFVWDGDVLLHEWVETTPEGTEAIAMFGGAPARKRASASQDVLNEDESTGYVEPAFVARKQPKAQVRDAPTGLVTYLHDPDTLAPCAKLFGERAWSIVCDAIGTPVQMLDEGGRVVWAGELSIWGELRMGAGKPVDLPFRFLGQYEDWETGLYYNRHRYYHALTGQYINADIIGIAGGLSLYSYVDDPLVQFDLLGLAASRLGEMTDHELFEHIHEVMYRNKRLTGKPAGRHGLIHRIGEQIVGKMRPGTTGWATHEREIEIAQSHLRNALLEWERRELPMQDPKGHNLFGGAPWDLATQPPPTGREQHVPKGCK